MTPAQQAKRERELLEAFVKSGNRFRECPIVDDDFPALRDEFDLLLGGATNYIKNHPPLIVNETSVGVDGCMGMQECRVTIISEGKHAAKAPPPQAADGPLPADDID